VFKKDNKHVLGYFKQIIMPAVQQAAKRATNA